METLGVDTLEIGATLVVLASAPQVRLFYCELSRNGYSYLTLARLRRPLACIPETPITNTMSLR